jgi:hypothetical protein
MAIAIGRRLPRTSSSATRNSARLGLLEAAWLVGLGAVAVFVHAATRQRFDLPPGHEGLVLVALLLVGRAPSKARWAGLTAAAGAASVSMLPVWGFGDPYRWAEYLLIGVTLDVGFWALYRWNTKLWLLAPLGGIAFMTKPLLRTEISAFTGMPFPSLLWGVAYPAMTYFIFGLVGAAIGAGAVLAYRQWGRDTTA